MKLFVLIITLVVVSCSFFEEEIAETHTCVKTNLDAVGCDTSRANELTASYDYLHNITCRNQCK